MRKILLFLAIFTSLKGYTVSQIEFKGLYHLSEDSAKEIILFGVGEVSPKEIDSAIINLYKQGYFQDVYADYSLDNQKLTFHLQEKPMISRVSLKGFLDNQEEQQNELLTVKKGSVLDEQRVEENRLRIIEAMNFKGTVDNIVEVEKELIDNGSIDLKFVAREGENIVIDKLNLYGANSFTQDEIEAELTNREREFLGWLIGRDDGKMKIRELQLDSMKIREFYMKNGFLDVKVSKPFAEIDFDNYRATLSFHIDEGSQYRVRDISIDIDENVTDVNSVKSRLLLKSSDKFNVTRLRKDMESIKRSIADKGYAFVEVSPDIDKVENSDEVDIKYIATVGEQVYIRDVFVSNNNRTMDRIIRREVYLAPGDKYNLTDLIDSKSALGRLGYFESVDIEEKRVSDNEMDLIISVKESPTGTIQIGGGYSSYSGALFDAGIQDRNIFGSGMNVGLNMQYSQLSTNYSLSLTNPRINDSLYSGGISVYQNEFEYDYGEDEYTSKDIGFGLNVGRRFTRNIRATLGYNYSDTKYNNVSSDFIDLLESYSKSSLSLNLSYDTTDDYFVPRKGILLTDRVEFAGLGGDAKFLKNTLSFGAYKGLEDYIDFDLILRYKARVRTLDDRGFIPINESFHMGGVSSVRGYESFAFPDRDNDLYKSFLGKKSFTNSLEASLPISQKARLRMTFFVDYGWLSNESWFEEFDRGGYGTALEWISPMAPIQFIFSRPFNDKTGDKISKFEFTIGQRF